MLLQAVSTVQAGYAMTKSRINITAFSRVYVTKEASTTNQNDNSKFGLNYSGTMWFSHYLGWLSGSANKEQVSAWPYNTGGTRYLDLSRSKTDATLEGHRNDNLYFIMLDEATSFSYFTDVWIQ